MQPKILNNRTATGGRDDSLTGAHVGSGGT